MGPMDDMGGSAMKRTLPLALVGALAWVGCASAPPKVYWREMLGKSIADFTEPVRDNNADKVWLRNMDDKAGAPAPSPFDALAYEVFANYLTQKRKGRVIESHHHNYMTEANPQTHKPIEVIQDGKIVGTYSSCEDLCMLDEAKKRRADKVL